MYEFKQIDNCLQPYFAKKLRPKSNISKFGEQGIRHIYLYFLHFNDFPKDLDITEGKSTGIPTITAAMKANGSPAVKYEFDDSYSWFMATVPVHPVFLNDTVNEDRK